MDKTTTKIVVGFLVLVILLVFNPGIDAHREALYPYVEKSMDEAYHKSDWLSKIGLLVGGGAIKSTIIDSIHRKSYGVFSVGYVGDEVVSLGVLGYVHVFE